MRLLRDELMAVGAKLNQMVSEKTKAKFKSLSRTLDVRVPFQIKSTSTRQMIHVLGVGLIESKGIMTRGHNKTRMRRKRKFKGFHMCRTCKQLVIHDSRNCPNKPPQQ